MVEIFKTILDVGKSILGMSEQLRVADKQRRADMAELFDNISACLAAVSTEIRGGGIPHGRCGELLQYAEALPGKVRNELGDARADELGRTLRSAHNVEGAAMDLQKIHDAADKEPYLQEIEEASGKFRALSNLVKIG